MVQSNRQGKQNLLVFIMLLITVAAVCVAVWALFFRNPETVLVPDQAPMAMESQAEPIPGDNGKPEAAKPGSGSVSLTYSDLVTIDLGRKTASLLFANPGRSNQDMVLQLVIQETVVLQSGRIKAGNQVTALELPAESAAMLAPGGYSGCFMVSYYDPVSGDRAIVTTEIPVSVTVTE